MEAGWRAMRDAWGPAKVLLLADERQGLEGFVVVDDVSAGPAIGGVRMAPDVTVAEVFRLARAMTLKNAAAGLAHGGAKGGIVADPRMDPPAKERLMRAFARAIASLTEYIPGPDMGTDETCMAWVFDEIGRAVGLPAVLGGIPLDTVGATGYGVAAAARAAQQLGVVTLAGARVVVQGFGAVGTHAARFLTDDGAVVVGVADSSGATTDAGGLDLGALLEWKADGHPVVDFPKGTPGPAGDLVGLPCDIWVPAARPDVLTAANSHQVRARLVLQGANIPATSEAEQVLHERGVVSVPDFIANAGGVICAAVEHRGGTLTQALATIDEKVTANTLEVLRDAAARDVMPRTAALDVARRRVDEARSYRT